MKIYAIRDRESGTILHPVKSIEEGKKYIAAYEKRDKADGYYTPDFYEVAEVDDADAWWNNITITER